MIAEEKHMLKLFWRKQSSLAFVLRLELAQVWDFFRSENAQQLIFAKATLLWACFARQSQELNDKTVLSLKLAQVWDFLWPENAQQLIFTKATSLWAYFPVKLQNSISIRAIALGRWWEWKKGIHLIVSNYVDCLPAKQCFTRKTSEHISRESRANKFAITIQSDLFAAFKKSFASREIHNF